MRNRGIVIGVSLVATLALSVGGPADAVERAVAEQAGSSKRKGKKRGWQTLRAKGGFRIKAPRGYRLRRHKGAYEISGRAGKMTLLALRTGGATRAVAEALLGPGLPLTPNADQFGLRLRLKRGRSAEIYFSRVPFGVAVTTLQPAGKKARKGKRRRAKRRGAKRRIAQASRQRGIGRAQRRLFARVARSARNLRAVGLPIATTQEQEAPIPLKEFTAADGSAKAMVPDAPGWTASGSKGVIEGSNPDLGGFAFGVLSGYLEPGNCLFPPCGLIEEEFMPADEALEEAWPQWINQIGGTLSDVEVVSQIPGSDGLLGPGMDSGMFQLSFKQAGRPATAYVIAGSFPSIDGVWYLYYSYIAAFVGVPGNVGDALLRTWQSWDPSADQARRQAETFVSLQETTAIIQSAHEYRRSVYEKTNYNWDAYIRGKDPVLDPVAPGAIGEGGQTLVQGPEGKFFNFAGQQFKKPGT